MSPFSSVDENKESDALGLPLLLETSTGLGLSVLTVLLCRKLPVLLIVDPSGVPTSDPSVSEGMTDVDGTLGVKPVDCGLEVFSGVAAFCFGVSFLVSSGKYVSRLQMCVGMFNLLGSRKREY